MKNRALHKNNKGFSFVLVLIGMSIVGLLVSAIFYSVYQNYLMKMNNLKSEDNFYSTEKILDEIKAGLQTDMSEAVTEAYGYVLERYTETEGQDATRDWYFETKYVDALRAKMIYVLASEVEEENIKAQDNVYDIEKLAGYIKAADRDNRTVVVEGSTATVTMADGGKAVVSINASNVRGSLDINYSSGVTLKDLKVEYTDKNGYYSVISTDLCMEIPKISFTQTSTAPDVLSYAIIATEGVTTQGTSGNTVVGNLFAGTKGLLVSANNNVSISSRDRAIIEGKITLAASGNSTNNVRGSLSFTGDSLWAHGIDLDNNTTFNASGNIYVKDDLTVQGANVQVALAGNYFGFSNPNRISANVAKDPNNKATDSSAIVVNGRNTYLNVSGLNSIMLAGNSYVKANASALQGSSTEPVLMGESLAVKSNQLMYLTPSQVIEVSGDTVFVSGNPIKYLDTGAVVTMRTDIRVAELGNKTLAELGINSGDCQVYYTQNDTAYVYMDLDDQQAATYSAAYYNSAAGAKIKEYMSLYLNDIQIPASAQIQTNGNIFAASKMHSNTITADSNFREIENEEVSYQEAYLALTKSLMGSYSSLSDADKANTVFNNLVYTSIRQGDKSTQLTLNQFFSQKGVDTFSFVTAQDKVGIVTKTDYTVKADTSDDNVHLLVVDGDVILEANATFSGAIICSGEVIMGAGSRIIANAAQAAAVFQCIYSDGTTIVKVGDTVISPMYFFRDGEQYLLSSMATGSITGEAGKLIDVADFITYRNWKKM